MNTSERRETLEKASRDMCKALNTFGSEETLKLLLEFSKDDPIVNDLLTIYPAIVATGDFLFGRPAVQIDKETFETLIDANPEIWIKKEKNNPGEEDNICENPPKKPKKTRSRKKNLIPA